MSRILITYFSAEHFVANSAVLWLNRVALGEVWARFRVHSSLTQGCDRPISMAIRQTQCWKNGIAARCRH